MKKLFFLGSILSAFISYAQELPVQDTVKAWSVVGQNTLMLNQSAFSNWEAPIIWVGKQVSITI